MDKICPLLISGNDRKDILLSEGIAKGDFMCLGDICAAYRYTEDVDGWEIKKTPYCGMAGKLNV